MGKKIDLSKYDDHVILGPIVRYLNANIGILAAFIILCVVLTITTDSFMTLPNWLTILRTVSTTGFLAIGVMLAIMLGGIDLIAGAMIACSGCLVVVCMERFGMNMILTIVIGLVLGIIVGFINGAIIAYSGIHPFVVTLAMQSILRGAAYLIADGQPVPLYVNTVFPKIGTGLAFGVVPYPIIYMLVFFFLQYLLLNKTKMGRYIYAVGGNATAAQFSGIDIKKVKIMVWTISGFLASFAGIVLSARLASGYFRRSRDRCDRCMCAWRNEYVRRRRMYRRRSDRCTCNRRYYKRSDASACKLQLAVRCKRYHHSPCGLY